ncbi:MAG: hypothetical protein ABEJ42_08205 [Halobacteriaceae archaeon]
MHVSALGAHVTERTDDSHPHRRAVLAGAAGVAAGLAGCTGLPVDLPNGGVDGIVDRRPAAGPRRDGDRPAGRRPTTGVPGSGGSPAGDAGDAITPVAVDADPDQVVANAAPLAGRTSHFLVYGPESAQVTVRPEVVDAATDGRYRLAVAVADHPDGDTVHGWLEGTESVDLGAADERVTLRATGSVSGPLAGVYGLAFLVPDDADPASAAGDAAVYCCETDRFVVDAGGTAHRDAHPDTLGDAADEGYERREAEGAYLLSFSGTTRDREWTVSYVMYKSNTLRHHNRPRTLDRPASVDYAMTDGVAAGMADIVAAEARDRGFTDRRDRVAFLVDFVQSLPYVTDEVSTGFDDYTKYVTETFTEAAGDCEDTSIALAALLESGPFGFDAILIQPPGHMATGVAGGDRPGASVSLDGRTYYYVETTGGGWDVGQVPEEYRGESAELHQV